MTKKDIQIIRAIADDMMRTDGDRDHMNKSDLSCQQTQACAKVLRLCADEIERLRAAVTAERGG